MKNKRRLIWAGVLLIVFFVWWFFRCNGHYVTIGNYESKDAGLRAAIPKLASELRICPLTDEYRIVWIGPDPDENQRVDRRALLYDRSLRQLGYEHDVYSGMSGKVYLVDEAAIRAISEKGGTLDDFAEYDQSPK